MLRVCNILIHDMIFNTMQIQSNAHFIGTSARFIKNEPLVQESFFE